MWPFLVSRNIWVGHNPTVSVRQFYCVSRAMRSLIICCLALSIYKLYRTHIYSCAAWSVLCIVLEIYPHWHTQLKVIHFHCFIDLLLSDILWLFIPWWMEIWVLTNILFWQMLLLWTLLCLSLDVIYQTLSLGHMSQKMQLQKKCNFYSKNKCQF